MSDIHILSTMFIKIIDDIREFSKNSPDFYTRSTLYFSIDSNTYSKSINKVSCDVELVSRKRERKKKRIVKISLFVPEEISRHRLPQRGQTICKPVDDGKSPCVL